MYYLYRPISIIVQPSSIVYRWDDANDYFFIPINSCYYNVHRHVASHTVTHKKKMKKIDDEQHIIIHKKMSPQRRQSTEHDDAQIAPNDSTDLEFKISLDCKRFTYLAFFLTVIFPLLVSSFVPGGGAAAATLCSRYVVTHTFPSIHSPVLLYRFFLDLFLSSFFCWINQLKKAIITSDDIWCFIGTCRRRCQF